MNIKINIISGLILGIGLYLCVADICRFPDWHTVKRFRKNKKKTDKKEVFAELVNRMTDLVTKYIRLSDYKRNRLETDLRAVGEDITPERYVAMAVAKAAMVGIFAIPFLFVFPILGAVILSISIVMYRGEIRKLTDKINIRRSKIETELPRFATTIEKTVKHNRDVLSMIEGYIPVAGNTFAEELKITAADMRSGNYEVALSRLESRIGSSYMSDITRGLIGVARGDDTSAYWATLSIKFADYQRLLLKEKAAKVPGQVRMLSLMLLGCFMMIYVVVIGISLINSIGSIF